MPFHLSVLLAADISYSKPAVLIIFLKIFGSVLSRYKIEYYLNGSGASSNDSEVIFGNKEQSFDIQTDVNHEAPATEGRVVEKSILRNKLR